MPLIKEKVGNLISQVDERNTNSNFGAENVRGISVKKMFTETKANLHGVSLRNYKIVKPQVFAYVADTSRRGDKIAVACNTSTETYLISSIYTTFKVSSPLLLPAYLELFFNRAEFDRLARYNSWGSARETFDWKDFCALEIDLPSVEIQKKYVVIYHAIQTELKVYFQTESNLHRVCSIFLDDALKNAPKIFIGDHIEEVDNRNFGEKYNIESVRGIATKKEFIATKANMNGVSLANYKIVAPQEFAYVADTSRRGDKISLAYNESSQAYIVSSITTVFRIKTESQAIILPEYLYLFLRRGAFDRYARYNSWGSAREAISWEDFGLYQIPLLPIEKQSAIINLFRAERQCQLNTHHLSEIQNTICPVLIAGALKEGAKK